MNILYKDKLLHQMVFAFLRDSLENYEGRIGYQEEYYCEVIFFLKDPKVSPRTRHISEKFEIGYDYQLPQHTRVVFLYVNGVRAFTIENQHDFDLFVDWANEWMTKFYVWKQKTPKRH